MATCQWSQNQCVRLKLSLPWKAWISLESLLTHEVNSLTAVQLCYCACLSILAAVTCMPFPIVIVRTFHHAVVHWCTLRDAKGLWLLVDVVSHLVLQVYLGPTGEKQLYHVSMPTVTSEHQGSPAILSNKWAKGITTVMNMGTGRCTFAFIY